MHQDYTNYIKSSMLPATELYLLCVDFFTNLTSFPWVSCLISYWPTRWWLTYVCISTLKLLFVNYMTSWITTLPIWATFWLFCAQSRSLSFTTTNPWPGFKRPFSVSQSLSHTHTFTSQWEQGWGMCLWLSDDWGVDKVGRLRELCLCRGFLVGWGMRDVNGGPQAQHINMCVCLHVRLTDCTHSTERK